MAGKKWRAMWASSPPTAEYYFYTNPMQQNIGCGNLSMVKRHSSCQESALRVSPTEQFQADLQPSSVKYALGKETKLAGTSMDLLYDT